MFDIIFSGPGLLIIGIVIGVSFDEFFTTRFAWLKREAREEISDLVAKAKARF